jgi:subtilisin family serine protease
MARRGVVLFASVLLILSQAVGAAASGNRSGPAAQQVAAPIAAGLVAELRSGARSSFVVEFRATTDLRGAGKLTGKTAKGTFVHDSLTKTAASSQADAVRATRGLNGIKATTYWLTNVMIVKANVARGHQPDRVIAGQLAKLAEKLARTPGVSSIRAETVMRLIEPVKNAAGINAVTPEWGVDKINAPAVWAEGITGAGIVVGTIDTGVEYTHEALVEHYRGNLGGGTFDHNYNWWDPSGICPEAAPCDNVFHGTHTMGSIVGGDLDGPLPDIGVAPGAKWIAAKGCEDLGCSESALLSSGQFMVAPTDLNGENPDPSKAPDLVSNSWGNDNPDDPFYLETVQAWRAAGIIPVFAAGNAGPGCGTAGTPGNYVESISVGATDIDDNIAGFSSRGPSPTDKISPNVSAPGVDVNSSVPGNGYGTASGTSMATPHVAGTIALMMSSKLELIGDFDAILNALNVTAIDRPDDQCGSPDVDLDPNFVYGEGRIDAKAAVDLVKSGGTLAGTVTDDATTNAIAGARVVADNGERQFATTTADDGTYDLFLPAGTYTVSASAFGYATGAVFGTLIETDVTTTEDFALVALPRFTVSGTVSSAGSPVENATVVALGTPVPAAVTDAAGQYAIELPIGTYTLRATLGGCTDSALADISSTGDNVVQDFALQRKIDGYGHACRPIAFDWIDAVGQTAMYGDDNVGYLRLPFAFPFYNASYSSLYVSTNGNVNFLAPNADFVPVGIPSPSEPNAAIYAFWRDLIIDEEASIDSTTVGSGDTAAFVIEYSNVLLLGTDARMSFEMKLWANGTIDFLYGDNPGAADGHDALVGIENATGSDALQISFMEAVIQPSSAIRIETLPVAIVTGTVSDANDGLGIPGASVSAEPGGRSTTTDGDGHYDLRVLAGSYDVTASANNYVAATQSLTLAESQTANVDFSLAAATAAVDPTSFDVTLGLGETVDRTVTLSNDGGNALTWEAKERDLGATPPDLPPAIAGVYRTPNWQPPHTPNVATYPTRPFAASDLPIIIDDPDNDSFDSNELLDVRGQSNADTMELALDYAPSMPIEELGGYIYLDTDQDPSTGLPPEAHFGLPTQDIGFDYFVHLFDVPFAGTVPLFDVFGNFILEVPATVEGTTISFGIPLAAFGGDDGNIDVAMVTGFQGPSDWAPDEGHGTVQAFSDVSWLSESPESGDVASGSSQDVTLTIGSPTLPPGDYHGQAVFVTNAPKAGQVTVDVILHVTIPAEFGRVTGTITDAHTGAPVAGASVTLHATWLGSPTDFTSTTADDGTWSVIGPEGTWPVDVAADGYVGTSLDATIVRGVTTSGADASIHRAQPHSSLDESPLVFVLPAGHSKTATVVLDNTGGHVDLTFDVFERGGGATVAGHAPTTTVAAGTSSAAPAGWVGTRVAPRAVGGTSLVLVDINPWDSDAIQQELSANGVAYDVMGSKEMDSIDFAAYDVIYVANDQPQTFYDAITNNFDRLSAYVTGGGYLWFGSAAFGFQDGNLDGFVLPGGLSIHGPAYEDFNTVAAPDHPLMAGMPNPFAGSSASHVTFGDLPAGATVIATGQASGEPTLVEYDFGAGRVLAVGQPFEFAWLHDQDAKLIIVNGVPYTQAFQPFTDVPWLSEAPITGSVAPDGSVSIDITVDTTGVEPGLYQADVVVLTNDPDHSRFTIPVTLVVPKYQQGINAGGGAYTTGTGNSYAADRAYASGAYGWVGSSSTRSTALPIAGTDDDPLYQNGRVGMTSYRFDVPDGVYKVDLSFAEVQNRRAGGRVFSVSLEGGAVLSNFDIVAAAGGQRTAYDRSFLVEVTDGVLNIGFTAQRGDAPLINAIFVTELPDGAPGR